MNQLTENQMQVFTRAIMPELYRLQKKYDSRHKPMGGVYHLDDPNDYKAVIETLRKQGHLNDDELLPAAA